METGGGIKTILTAPQMYIWKVHCVLSLLYHFNVYIFNGIHHSICASALLFGFGKKPFIFSVYYYFTFSISIVLTECIGLSFRLFFCLFACTPCSTYYKTM